MDAPSWSAAAAQHTCALNAPKTFWVGPTFGCFQVLLPLSHSSSRVTRIELHSPLRPVTFTTTQATQQPLQQTTTILGCATTQCSHATINSPALLLLLLLLALALLLGRGGVGGGFAGGLCI
jgi:hypothetical protein